MTAREIPLLPHSPKEEVEVPGPMWTGFSWLLARASKAPPQLWPGAGTQRAASPPPPLSKYVSHRAGWQTVCECAFISDLDKHTFTKTSIGQAPKQISQFHIEHVICTVLASGLHTATGALLFPLGLHPAHTQEYVVHWPSCPCTCSRGLQQRRPSV